MACFLQIRLLGMPSQVWASRQSLSLLTWTNETRNVR
jgi:hypothetical protein